MHLPPLYPILDAETLTRHNLPLLEAARALHAAGITLLQYRDKQSTPRAILANTLALKAILRPATTLILNDHPDLARQAGVGAVHLGQTDPSEAEARRILGPQAIIGLSTHNLAQVEAALQTSADYIAIGPIYPTATKQNADPITGLGLLRHARSLTTKPIVAIGGITLATARQVRDAGADSIALISALIPPDSTTSATTLAEAFLNLLA